MKYDVNETYYSEANKYSELVTKVGRTSTGSGSWESPSSGITYTYTTNGEDELLNILEATPLADNIIKANDWNNLVSDVQTSIAYSFKKVRLGGLLSV